MVINQDAKLCTSHDYLLAEVIAYELLALHIDNRIDNLNQSCAITNNKIHSNLHWTAKKIDLGDNITRSFIDIKNRKTDQTRFLNQLQAALETKIENDLN